MREAAHGPSARHGGRLSPALPLALALCFASVVSLLVGASHLPIGDALQGLIGSDPSSTIIMRDIRLPRVLLSVSVGGMLALAGAGVQALTRNPLAEPAVLGTPQAAALGAVLVLYTGLAGATSVWLTISAIGASAVAVVILMGLIHARQSILTLLLAGLGIGSLAGAAMSLVISLSPNPYAVMEIVFWLMGSFEDRSLFHVAIALPFMLAAGAMILMCRTGYTALTLGEDAAQSLGVDVARLSWLTAAGVAVGIGAAVAVSGSIGFVGLVAPHLVRPWCSGDPGRTLVPAALCGALITTVADIFVRIIPATSEIRVGVLTALFGAPLFIWLVVRQSGFISRSAP